MADSRMRQCLGIPNGYEGECLLRLFGGHGIKKAAQSGPAWVEALFDPKDRDADKRDQASRLGSAARKKTRWGSGSDGVRTQAGTVVLRTALRPKACFIPAQGNAMGANRAL